MISTNLTFADAPASQMYCDSPLWDASISWWTTLPDVTPCFQYAIVRLIPCFWFWLLLTPFKLWHLRTKRLKVKQGAASAKRRPYSKLTYAKLTFCGVLILLAMSELIQSVLLYAFQVLYRPNSQFLTPAIEAVTLAWAAILICYERKHGHVASGELWLFWLFETTGYLVVTYSAGLNYYRLDAKNEFSAVPTWNTTDRMTNSSWLHAYAKSQRTNLRWTVDAWLVLIVILRLIGSFIIFVLSCFADHEVDAEVLQNDSLAPEFGNRFSPELSAGFVNRLLFGWVFSIVRRGASKSLEPSDLCSLNPIDRSSANTFRFERIHNIHIAAWRKSQDALSTCIVRKTDDKGHDERVKLFDTDPNENPKLSVFLQEDGDDGDIALSERNNKNVNGTVDDELATAEDAATPLRTPAVSKKRKQFTATASSGQSSQRLSDRIRQLFQRKKHSLSGKNNSKAKRETKEPKSEFEDDKVQYPSALWSLLQVYWKDIARSYAAKLIQDVLIFVNTGLVALLIRFADDPERFNYAWKGALFAVTLAINQIVMSIALQQTYNIGIRCGTHMRTAVTTALYRKALTISNAARSKATLGELVNLMSVDAQFLQDLIGWSWAFWSCPLQILVACLLIWFQMGPAMLAGLATMVFFFAPINAIVAMRQRRLRESQMRFKDQRIQQVNELLAGIRLVKLYAWELPFLRRVTDTRDREISVIRKAQYLAIIQDFVFNFAPYLVTLVTFGVYVAISDQELTAQRAFVTLNLFQVLRFPLGILPIIIQMSVTAVVSVKRISRFLAQPDLNDSFVTHERNEAEPITLDNATFGWSASSAATTAKDAVLSGVTLHVRRGELLAIVGRVGCGKSTLISAMLGEAELLGGRVNVSGSVAYVAQQSWIQNASLRDNVLFGSAYDETKYKSVLAACALDADLAMLPGGDQTEIGEKGINLSGGQKQRVALARAVYADADIYLFDDPLSAVDVHVGKHIFEQLVGPRGLLRGKTRVLVTHGLHWLRSCDRIAVLDLNSKSMIQLGPYDELISAHDSFLLNHLHLDSDRDREAALNNASGESEQDVNKTTDGSGTNPQGSSSTAPMSSKEDEEVIRESVKKQEEQQKLIQDEKRETGSVKARVYLTYFRAQPLMLFVAYAIVQALGYCFFISADWWVARWTEDPRLTGDVCVTTSTPQPPVANWTSTAAFTSAPINSSICYTEEERSDARRYYMGVYSGIGVIVAIVMVAAATLNVLGALRASRVLHASMLDRILHAPMNFFDSTPTGRIVNRFSKDVEMVDNLLAFSFRSWMQTFYSVVFAIIGVCVGTPLVLTVVIPAIAIYYFVQRFFIPTSRQLKRLESTSKSPMFTHFSESLQGASTIRAFGARDRFIAESERRTDRNNVYCFMGLFAYRWIGVYLDIISALFVAGAAIFCVVTALTMSTTGGRVGLSLTYALNIAGALNWMVRMNSEIETNIVSVERIKEYSEVEQEATWERTKNELSSDNVQLSADWPAQGEIVFDAYSTRYRENLDLVLRDLSLQVKSGEKIGIVGRTGAGKSSFTLALFRMIERVNGRILIDGVDVSCLGIHQLRSKLTILPQDPVVFSGTLRANLDPFDAYTDEQIWHALELAGIRNQFMDGDGLRYECTESGSNLSVGQRQLLCLARALLRKTKVLVLDEATAAVDLRTDELIQRTIRSAFADCTVLTIAHRLNTVMDYDKILVLDRGMIAEFDAPAVLLAQPDSVFAQMVRESAALHK